MSLRRREAVAGYAFLAPSVIGLGLFTLLPIGISLWMSLHRWPAFGEREFVGLDNFAKLIGDSPMFHTVLINTGLFVLCYVPLNLAVSLGLATWLSPRIAGRSALRVLFFIPVITPMVANVLVWKMLYQPRGAIDGTLVSTIGEHAPNFLADPGWAMPAVVAMSVWQGFGYNMIIFSAALAQVPAELTEAAVLDGAGPVRKFFSVVLPAISPAVFFATVMTTISALQVFTQPYLLTQGGPGVATETVVGYIYKQGFKFSQLGLASTAAWILFVIIIGITAVQFVGQRRWVHYEN